MDLLTAARNMVERLHGEAKAPPVELAYQELRVAVADAESKAAAPVVNKPALVTTAPAKPGR